ncbi:MAG: hypothetical protein PHR06_04905 [Candidatus Cloacimonetes bacterium]|nr:hypothetical protein [Candidatus Cloacimonadota bacterium]
MIENYVNGKAKEIALINLQNYAKHLDGAKVSHGSFMDFQYNSLKHNPKDIPAFEMFIPAWAGELTKFGHGIDKYFDDILSDAVKCNDKIYSFTSAKKLKSLLILLIEKRKFIKGFERECESFDLFTTFGNPYDLGYFDSVNNAKSDIWNTYNDAFTIINLKLKNISSSRITFSNISLSIVALIVAILSLLNS